MSIRSNQKYVNAIFVVAGAIIWLISKHYIKVLIGAFRWGRSLGASSDLVEHGLPLCLGVLTFFILWKNSKSYNFVSDSVSELIKISWPSEKDVRLGTIVVIIAVILAGLFFGVIDLGFNAIIQTLLST